MADEHAFASDNDLGDPLRAAVLAVRAQPISDDTLDRVEERLLVLVSREPTAGVSSATAPGRPLRRRMKTMTAALAVCLVLIVCLFVFLVPGPRVTLAQVQSALARQKWVLLKYEDGEEHWVSLLDGRQYLKEASGRVQYFAPGIWQQYLPPGSNRLVVFNDGRITESRATVEEMRTIPKWSPQSAYRFLMGQVESIDKASDERNHPYRVEKAVESANGQELVRFDVIWTAAPRVKEGVAKSDGQEVVAIIGSSDGEELYSQVWVNPKTQLPVRSRKRSFSADGFGLTGGFVDGVYLFSESGPKDIYALGVPRDAKIVRTYWGAGAEEIPDQPG